MQPDALVLDIMMPGTMDGLDLCKKIRTVSQVPIIFVSAKDEAVDRIIGLELGADDYLTKPFDIEELIIRIRALLKRTSQIPKSSAIRELLTYKEITLLPETYSVQIKDKIQKLSKTYRNNGKPPSHV